MPTRPLLPLLFLLSMPTNCTAFGPDGTVPMALHRDRVNLHQDCRMSTQEWMEKCGEDYWTRLPSQQRDCPDVCKPAR